MKKIHFVDANVVNEEQKKSSTSQFCCSFITYYVTEYNVCKGGEVSFDGHKLYLVERR
jgi:hypothetical protein